MASTYTLTGNLKDLIGGDLRFINSLEIQIATNMPAGEAVIADGVIHLGSLTVDQTAGAFSIAGLIATNAIDANFAAGTLRYQVTITYRDGPGARRTWTSGWFELTANANLGAAGFLANASPFAVQSASAFVAEGRAIRDSQVDISNIATSDSLVEALVKNTAGAGPLTSAALTATYATGGEVRSKAKADGTDQTAIVQAELDALYDAGGGTLVLRSSPLGAVPIKVTNLTLKNDGATPAKMPTIGLRGQGMHWSGRGTAPQGGTIIEFTGTDTYGLLKSNALGALVIEGITFRNTAAATSTPFIYTTNTTLMVSRSAFYGAKAGAACDQDAIVLGGPNQVEGGSGWTDGFQGYGTVIRENFFSGIRRVVVGQAFANAVIVRDNTVWTTCGHPTGAAIEWDGQPTTGSQSTAGCVIEGNLIELPNYKYGIKIARSTAFTLAANNMYDSTGTTTAAIHLDAETSAMIVREGFTPAGLPPLVDLGTGNWFAAASQGIYSTAPPTKFPDNNYPTEIYKLKVTGPDSFGLIVQPSGAQVDGSTMMQTKRSAAEGTNPGAAITSWKQDGSVLIDPTANGGGNITGPYSRFQAGGRTWSGVGSLAGQENGSTMTVDSGPGGSYLDLKNYGVRFYDHNGGPLRVTIGAGANQIRFGTAAAINDRPGVISGAGTPEAVVTAPVGSMFLRTDGGAGTTMYVKESGAGNTGWVAK